MDKLKEKDKKLLVFLAVFVIAVITLTQVILPAMEKKTAIEAEIAAAEVSIAEADAKLAVYESNKLIYEAVAEEYAAASANFYDRMENEAIDRLITGIVLENWLEARDLSINGGDVLTAVTPYYAAQSAAAADGAAAAVYISSLSLRVEGPESRLLSLIDLFTNEYPAIRVTGYSISGSAADGVLNISLELYMCDK